MYEVNRKTLVEQVAIKIEALIEAGEWQIGEKLPPEMVLMKQFDVSRNTLREAIRALVHAGLLETKHGSGTIVRSTNAIDLVLKKYAKNASLLEILDVRVALEQKAAALAAENRTEKALAAIQKQLKICQVAIEVADTLAFIEADMAFHKAIVHASENQLLIHLYEPLTEMIYDFIENILARYEMHDESMLHKALFKAIVNQDALATKTEIDVYSQQLKKLLENR